ncbi:hypothetical protein [Streptomyces scabiei]|uniref:hypothetical protein n=1 Tax=Streptomyces scabiei TaxID=1930 RepID=UPI0029BF1105|nr:hypothetical protein [Streptomyces scabiei]MDX2531560.1 hypothetical protein [Streptomyces scabiei]MDX2796618.1 hypothetical protein [Streptomyces scabiei]MDX2855854.1 hypothetical protein [Streptomyces scabiei]MDX3824594.1 hypothetical protein [Streptomyces scabiei]
MNSPIRPEQLRGTITDVLESAATWHELPGLCRRLGLDAPDQTDWKGGGKAKYVRALLEEHGLAELIDLARKVVEQVGSERLEKELALLGPRGASGGFRNLIFAGTGPKPEMVLDDSVGNYLEITANAEHWLFYDRPLTSQGLTWRDMLDWWPTTSAFTSIAGEVDASDPAALGHTLYKRLFASLPATSPPAQKLFITYCSRYGRPDGLDQPALIPEVHLHYDPYTRRERGGRGPLNRERMDFLLLLPNRVRIVIEVDGKHHYTRQQASPAGQEAWTAAPDLYSVMVAEDRALRLKGYEVYRFGGYELMQSEAEDVVSTFFNRLLADSDVSPPLSTN